MEASYRVKIEGRLMDDDGQGGEEIDDNGETTRVGGQE